MPDQDPITLDPSDSSPKLLISVRDRNEVTAIESLSLELRALIGVIDLKEPRQGSLGRVDQKAASHFLDAIPTKTVCSAALGELAEDESGQGAKDLPAGFDFAKIGLAGALKIPDWQKRWRCLGDSLPARTKSVAVAYLDHQSCDAPPPDEVCKEAVELGCRGVLLDTFDKSAGSFADHISSSELQNLLQTIRQKRMFSVLAGSIDQQTLPAAIAARPSLIGVRGAVCELDRAGDISEKSLKKFCQLFKAAIEQISDA